MKSCGWSKISGTLLNTFYNHQFFNHGWQVHGAAQLIIIFRGRQVFIFSCVCIFPPCSVNPGNRARGFSPSWAGECWNENTRDWKLPIVKAGYLLSNFYLHIKMYFNYLVCSLLVFYPLEPSIFIVLMIKTRHSCTKELVKRLVFLFSTYTSRYKKSSQWRYLCYSVVNDLVTKPTKVPVNLFLLCQ